MSTEGESTFGGQREAMLGDHPALDLLNTVAMVDGALVDRLQRDEDVLNWLELEGVKVKRGVPKDLLRTTRQLRAILRTAIEERKNGEAFDVTPLNTFLARGESHLVVAVATRTSLSIEREWTGGTAEQMLAPIAEAAAELLVAGDFGLVRRCESAECVLWFYDRTKSHKRRWCSMASCGNRHKVAAFRERQKAIG